MVVLVMNLKSSNVHLLTSSFYDRQELSQNIRERISLSLIILTLNGEVKVMGYSRRSITIRLQRHSQLQDVISIIQIRMH